MSKGRLRIGRINFSNLFPIFYGLEKFTDCSPYEFVEGVPSAVNRLLREGKIDISPSSSIEYIKNEDDYILMDNHSITSAGPVGSILLFSKRPMEGLFGATVLVSSQSETSVALLDIVLNKFHKMNCVLRSSDEPLSRGIESYPAYLLIGDNALRESLRWPGLYKYDLGEIWHRKTGLPFVFALWIGRKDSYANKPELFAQFKRDLDTAKANALKNLTTIARESSILGFLSEDEIVSYWKGISYDLSDEHIKGLELFRKYAEELNLVHI
ncbi:MAG TPA: menaquinone biosynthesis protein [Thermodesulfovibrionales bacterium]|nr:menaquinone biosynthesis protein [Thermodesulfovibrionales bacterium]